MDGMLDAELGEKYWPDVRGVESLHAHFIFAVPATGMRQLAIDRARKPDVTCACHFDQMFNHVVGFGRGPKAIVMSHIPFEAYLAKDTTHLALRVMQRHPFTAPLRCPLLTRIIFGDAEPDDRLRESFLILAKEVTKRADIELVPMDWVGNSLRMSMYRNNDLNGLAENGLGCYIDWLRQHEDVLRPMFERLGPLPWFS